MKMRDCFFILVFFFPFLHGCITPTGDAIGGEMIVSNSSKLTDSVALELVSREILNERADITPVLVCNFIISKYYYFESHSLRYVKEGDVENEPDALGYLEESFIIFEGISDSLTFNGRLRSYPDNVPLPSENAIIFEPDSASLLAFYHDYRIKTLRDMFGSPLPLKGRYVKYSDGRVNLSFYYKE